MLPSAAYLRIYEPLSAFGPAERAQWAAYAASADRPRRASALAAEHAEALRRLIALPPIVAPAQESRQAYVRWANGITYICPWQTRLRSWLALSRLQATARPPMSEAFAPQQAELAVREFARWEAREGPPRVYIQTSAWSVPLAWFVPFAPTERWLVLGKPAAGENRGPATAAATRALVYATAMSQARRRVARSLATARRIPRSRRAEPGQAAAALLRVCDELEEIGRWLEEFHPHSLVELDYGGLVQLLDNDALRSDQSAAEVSTAVTALANGELEVAAAMYQRMRDRWRTLEAIELGS
jgi:hypothetical protein